MTEKIKTGTTCIGLLFKDGVILAADRRVTAGGMIVGNKSTKIYDISSNILATTSGHAADNQLFVRIVQSEARLLELKNERQIKVKEAAMIFNSMQYSALRSQGSVVSLILGGYDKLGPSLYNLSPDGTIVTNEGFVVDGSGSIFIKAIFENEYNPNMTKEEALELIEKGFKSAFNNDNASGGGFIVRVVTKEGIEELTRKVVKTQIVKE